MVAYSVLSSPLLNAISLGSALSISLYFGACGADAPKLAAFRFAVCSRDCRLASRPRPDRARETYSPASLFLAGFKPARTQFGAVPRVALRADVLCLSNWISCLDGAYSPAFRAVGAHAFIPDGYRLFVVGSRYPRRWGPILPGRSIVTDPL